MPGYRNRNIYWWTAGRTIFKQSDHVLRKAKRNSFGQFAICVGIYDGIYIWEEHLRNKRRMMFHVSNGQINTNGEQTDYISFGKGDKNLIKNEIQVPLRLPDRIIIITGTQYGYARPDGVYVIPVRCLRD